MSKLNEVLRTVERLWPYLDQQTQQGVLALVREYGPKLAAAEAGGLPASAVDDMVKAVPDKLVSEIVRDLRGGPGEPGWLKPGRNDPAPRSNVPLKVVKRPEYGTEAQFERMVTHLVGGANDTSKLR